MKVFRGALASAVLILAMGIATFAADLKVRVVTSQANIRLKPDLQSVVISKVPLGGILDVIQKEGDWYQIKLPPDEKGIVVMGYIHESTVEIMETAAEVKKVEEKTNQVKKLDEEKPPIKSPEQNLPSSLKGKPLSEKEKKFMETDPYYLTWRTKLDQTKASQKASWKYIWIGGGAFLAGAIAWPLIGMGGEYSGPYGGGLIEQSTTTVGTICLIVATAGAGVATYGLIRMLVKGGQISKIMEEGMQKGYILGLNINPEKKQYALTFAIAF